MKTKLISLLSFINLISHLSSNQFYYLTNLDQQKITDSLDLASKAVQAIPKMDYTFTNQEVIRFTPLTIEENKLASFILQESNSIIIDSLVIKNKKGIELIPNEDYLVYPVISQFVIPSNYYEGIISNYKNEDKMKIVCAYFNLLPHFILRKFDKTIYTSIINTQNSNFAIENGKMISFKFIPNDNGLIELVSISIDTSEIKDDSIKTQFENLQKESGSKGILNLFLLQCHFDKRTMMAALQRDKTNENYYIIYVYEIIEINTLKVKAHAISHVHGEGEISQIGFKGEYLYVGKKGANGGLKLLKEKDYKYEDQGFNNERVQNVIDFIVNKRTVYVINDQGLHIYDFQMNLYHKINAISHPYLKKLDYIPMSMNETSPYFIGIAVDNHPPLYPEILIELIATDNELTPKLNKVFVTSRDIDIEDMVTDKYYSFNYIFDRTSSKMYIIKRGVPYIENTFGFVFDLSKNYTFTSGTQNHIALISIDGNEKKPVIVIMDNKQTVLFEDYVSTPQSLQCIFNSAGNYREIFSIQKDCSYPQGDGFVYQACEHKYIFNITVASKMNSVGIWIGVTVCIAIIIGIIVFLFCCRKVWNKPATHQPITNQYVKGQNNYDQYNNDSVKQKEMQEVDINSKL